LISIAHTSSFRLRWLIVVEENLTIDTQPEVTDAPAQPIVKVPPPESRFLFVDIAALRAKQLRRGARPRLAASDAVDQPRKPERVAMEEVRQGLVAFDIPKGGAEPSGEAP
jgi:DNA-directed RNA polymerase subunit K/omega